MWVSGKRPLIWADLFFKKKKNAAPRCRDPVTACEAGVIDELPLAFGDT